MISEWKKKVSRFPPPPRRPRPEKRRKTQPERKKRLPLSFPLYSPGVVRVPARVRLVLDRRLVEVVAADGARVGADRPRPHRDGVPLFDLKALGASGQRCRGRGGGLGFALGVGGGGGGSRGALDVHGVGHGWRWKFLRFPGGVESGERERESEREEMVAVSFPVFSSPRRAECGASFPFLRILSFFLKRRGVRARLVRLFSAASERRESRAARK